MVKFVQNEHITYSTAGEYHTFTHFENDSQIILSWSEILAPLKSIDVLSELHYHLSL